MVNKYKIYEVISDYQFYAYYEPPFDRRNESPHPVLIARFQAKESNRFHEEEQIRLDKNFLLDSRFQPYCWITKIDHVFETVANTDRIIDHILIYCNPFEDHNSWEVKDALR